MQSGDLTYAMAFDAPTQTQDGSGGTDAGWAEEYTCRAHVRYLRGTEAVMAARLAGRQPVVVTIRRCEASRLITPAWRMRDTREGDVYNIRAIVPSDDRAWLEITAEGNAP